MTLGGVLVLAAGKSTRIEPLSQGRPKPLLPFAGDALIGWNFRWLASAGLHEAWVNLHYRADDVRAALGDGSAWGVRLRFAHEPEILGTAGAWRALGEHWGATSLVLYGDNVSRFSLSALVETHHRLRTLATIAVFDPAVHANTGIAGGRVVVGADGRVQRFVEGAALEAGELGRVNAGAIVLERALLERVPPGFADFGRDLFPALAAEGALGAYLLEPGGFCLGLDTPQSFAIAESLHATGRISLA